MNVPPSGFVPGRVLEVGDCCGDSAAPLDARETTLSNLSDSNDDLADCRVLPEADSGVAPEAGCRVVPQDAAGFDEHDDLHRAGEEKTRKCLICKTAFHSAWAGERVCRRCKSTSTWRSTGLD
jgi:hypothetical protein